MPSEPSSSSFVLRVFEVRAKAGAREALLEKFATSSADVVRDAPGNRGYYFGPSLNEDENTLFFASLWESLVAVQARFGEKWQDAFLPDGYETLIESFDLTHIDLSSGWHIPSNGEHTRAG